MTSTETGARAPKQTGATLQKRYLLHELIGRGGMATVYRATDTVLDRSVAVKLLHPHLAREPQFVEQFLDMEQRIARLFHPHLVTIYDAGVADEGCFVVEEHVGGGSLRGLLADGRRLAVSDAISIVAQVAEALQLLHEQGIIHGDIKPDNILLDEHGNAKLVDFGIAHLATTTGAIDWGSLAGTAPYLAPEQLQGGRVDTRVDIYALGLVTYELLSGRRPFEGDNWAAVAAQRLVRDPASLLMLVSDVSSDLDHVVMACLARDPSQRFGTAEAFRQALLSAGEAKEVDRRTTLRPAQALRPAQGERERGSDGATADGGVTADGGAGLRVHPRREHAGTEARPTGVPVPRRLPSLLAAVAAQGRAMLRNTLGPHFSGTGTASHALTFATRTGVRDPAMLMVLAEVGLLALLVLALALPQLVSPPRVVQVPQLVGKSLPDVRADARQAGLSLSVSEQPSDTVAQGVVLRQDPPPNANLKSDRPVRVTVSSGRPAVKVPDLSRRRVEDAHRDLATVGLALGKVEEREVSTQPWGVIVSQSASLGSQLAKGSVVDVIIGVPPWTTAPKLVDKALGEAEAELEKRGLRLGAVQQQPASGKRAGTVVDQEPAADVRLRQGEIVHLTIAVPPPREKP